MEVSPSFMGRYRCSRRKKREAQKLVHATLHARYGYAVRSHNLHIMFFDLVSEAPTAFVLKGAICSTPEPVFAVLAVRHQPGKVPVMLSA